MNFSRPGGWVFFRLVISVLAAICLTGTLHAATGEKAIIPSTLEAWQDWVLRDQKQYDCTRVAQSQDKKRCLWPGPLHIVSNESGADFQQSWHVLAQQWIHLPGHKHHWPHQVTVNGQIANVREYKGRPALLLTPGDHLVEGQLDWSRSPQYLHVDGNTGLIQLTHQNRKKAALADKQNRLWLGSDDLTAHSAQSNTLKIEAFRLLIDDIPLTLKTEVRLTVAGEPREILVGQLLPDNTEVLSFSSPLPARIEADGRLRFQARPGEWRVQLTARYLEQVETFRTSRLDTQWPSQEIWSFQAKPHLRGVKVTGVNALDPSQIDLPHEFGRFPTYLMTQESQLTLAEDYRGDASPAANQLSLQRELWLDFDGKGATLRDQIRGSLTHDWRLRAAPGLNLGRVSAQGQPQVVTRLPGEEGYGVEVRQADVSVEALSRVEPLSAINATGWQHNFEHLRLTLNLPPGWKLWHASGPDRIASSWLSSWDLWDIFLCLLIIAATLRVLGWHWALISAATLALTYHEPGAPLVSWAVLIAVIPLLKTLPQNTLKRWLKSLSFGVLLTLIFIALAFAVQQIRSSLYPQLEMTKAINTYVSRGSSEASFQNVAEDEMLELSASAVRSKPRLKTQQQSSPQPQRYRPDDRVQTGPGEPTWKWRQVDLAWTGPVRAQEPLKLYLSAPWLTRSLKFFQVIVLGLFIYGLTRALLSATDSSPETKRHSGGRGIISSSSSLALVSAGLLALLMASPVGTVRVFADDFPPQKLLDELKTELLKAPACAPQCASLLSGHLNVQGENFTLRLRAASDSELALPLTQGDNWQPSKLLINGKVVPVARTGKQLWAKLDSGVHDLTLQGNIIGDNLNFNFTLPLRHVTVQAPGWQIQGLSNGQLLNKTLQLNKREQTQARDTLLPDPVQPFVTVERRLSQDIDWQVTTTVSRLAPQNGTINLHIPLLEGESVVSDHPINNKGEIHISLPGNQRSAQWRSVLKPKSPLQLQATDNPQWVEIWQVEASPRWHISSDGIPSVKTPGSPHPQWQPWPGETLTLTSVQPEPVPGPTTTIESALVEHTPGTRSAALSLSLKIRSSLGGDYRLQLPVEGELLRIEIDGKEQTQPSDGNEIVFPLRPGLQTVKAEWELAQGIDQLLKTPAFVLPTPANNIELKLHLPRDRWPLILQGPDIGPAILYWGVLVVIVAVAISLGWMIKKLELAIPVRTWQWLLLAVGMSTVSAVGSIPVVLWFFAMEWRQRKPVDSTSRVFNLTQLGLILLSIVAVIALFSAIPQSLLSTPDMQISGNGSSNFYYQWYQDHSLDTLPQAWVFSTPLWVYRISMLLWSLWLVFALLNWAKWGWQCLSSGKFWSNDPHRGKAPAQGEK